MLTISIWGYVPFSWTIRAPDYTLEDLSSIRKVTSALPLSFVSKSPIIVVLATWKLVRYKTSHQRFGTDELSYGNAHSHKVSFMNHCHRLCKHYSILPEPCSSSVDPWLHFDHLSQHVAHHCRARSVVKFRLQKHFSHALCNGRLFSWWDLRSS